MSVLRFIIAIGLTGFIGYQIFGLIKDFKIKNKMKKENSQKDKDINNE